MHSLNLTAALIAPPWWLALLLPAALALASWRLRWLTPSGAFAAFVVGLDLFGLGGGRAAAPLLTFFISSSLLSRLGRTRKMPVDRQAAKGAVRDSGQVWANGGMAVLLVLAHAYLRHHWPIYRLQPLQLLFLCALATVNADTWATEIGGWVGQTPRSLRDWKRVPPGTSGAITPAGTLAALAGAVIIPLSVVRLWPLNIVELLLVAWAGFLGSWIDSILGASLQAQHRDLATGELSERTEVDGRVTQLARGLRWIDNDVVNFLASAGGVLCGWILLRFAAVLFP